MDGIPHAGALAGQYLERGTCARVTSVCWGSTCPSSSCPSWSRDAVTETRCAARQRLQSPRAVPTVTPAPPWPEDGEVLPVEPAVRRVRFVFQDAGCPTCSEAPKRLAGTQAAFFTNQCHAAQGVSATRGSGRSNRGPPGSSRSALGPFSRDAHRLCKSLARPLCGKGRGHPDREPGNDCGHTSSTSWGACVTTPGWALSLVFA